MWLYPQVRGNRDRVPPVERTVQMPFSWLDVILAAIMLISGFLAMLRGLTREVLSILSWALAAVATLFFFPMYQAQARVYIEPALLADAVLAGGIFLVVL